MQEENKGSEMEGVPPQAQAEEMSSVYKKPEGFADAFKSVRQ